MTDLSGPVNGALVDWNAGKLLPAPRKNRPDRRETFFPTLCPQCKSVRWLRSNAAEKAEAEQRPCRRCQMSSAGKRGWATTVALYGADFARRASQRHQLLHPSRPEVLVDHLLFMLNARYERQVEFSAPDAYGLQHTFYLDFLVETQRGQQPLEVNGYWHKRARVERDRWLQELWSGLPVEFIDADTVIANPQSVEAHLRRLLADA